MPQKNRKTEPGAGRDAEHPAPGVLYACLRDREVRHEGDQQYRALDAVLRPAREFGRDLHYDLDRRV